MIKSLIGPDDLTVFLCREAYIFSVAHTIVQPTFVYARGTHNAVKRNFLEYL
jgi:hypothetical protein